MQDSCKNHSIWAKLSDVWRTDRLSQTQWSPTWWGGVIVPMRTVAMLQSSCACQSLSFRSKKAQRNVVVERMRAMLQAPSSVLALAECNTFKHFPIYAMIACDCIWLHMIALLHTQILGIPRVIESLIVWTRPLLGICTCWTEEGSKVCVWEIDENWHCKAGMLHC